mgnify:CR=1 FL=1
MRHGLQHVSEALNRYLEGLGDGRLYQNIQGLDGTPGVRKRTVHEGPGMDMADRKSRLEGPEATNG